MKAPLLALLVVAGCTTIDSPPSPPPNIVIINADDLGYGDLGCYGATHIRTPNIDRLASEGRRFTDAHAASAVCSPSRYGLLTGSYPLRRNLWGPIPAQGGLTIDPEDMTIARLLQEAGFATACIGKWHLGFGNGKRTNWNAPLRPGPLETGFDHYFGIPTVNSGPPFVYVKNHHVVGLDPDDPFVYGKQSVTQKHPEKGGYKVIGGAEAAHRLYDDRAVGTTLANRAVEWLQQHDRAKPFFLYLATTNIHHPFTPAQQFVGTSDCGLYGDFAHELDWIVGQVLATLDSMGVADNTLVIFTSDNGGMLHNTGQKSWRAGHRMNGDLLGFKFGAWEGGHRIPMLARWPGHIAAGSTSDHLISHIDLLATFASLVHRPLPAGQGIDSIDQLAVLTRDPVRSPRTTLLVAPNSPKHLAVRRGKWLFIPGRGGGGFQGKKVGNHLLSDEFALPFTGQRNSDVANGRIRADAPPAQLYNLERDPGQANNVFAQHSEIVAELSEIVSRYRQAIPPGKPIGWINLKQ